MSCDNNTIAENNTPRFEVNNISIFNELLKKTKAELDKIIEFNMISFMDFIKTVPQQTLKRFTSMEVLILK